MNKALVIFALGGISAAVLASDPPEKKASPIEVHGTPFAQLDRNGDGLVSLTEATSASWTHEEFDTVDRDDDGAIDPNEYAVQPK